MEEILICTLQRIKVSHFFEGPMYLFYHSANSKHSRDTACERQLSNRAYMATLFLPKVHTVCFASSVTAFTLKLLFTWFLTRRLQKRAKLHLCQWPQNMDTDFLLEDKISNILKRYLLWMPPYNYLIPSTSIHFPKATLICCPISGVM